MRLFFAAPLPPAALAAAARAQAALRSAAGERPRLSFADPAQLHITLAFLGEQPSAQAALDAGRSAFAGVRAFPASLAGTGAFPRPERPRVLWLGLAQGSAELSVLAARLSLELEARGIELERRPFHAHVTLARVRPGGERDAVRALRSAAAVLDERFAVERLALVESRLGGGGATHLEVEAYPLA